MKTKHLPLIVGIALPLIFIAIISLLIFIPKIAIKPEHDFLYTNQNYSSYYMDRSQDIYRVENNYLAVNGTTTPPLFLYDVKNNSSHQVSVQEAKNFILDAGPSSPDGYVVKFEYGNDGIFELFGSSESNYGYFISKDNAEKKLTGLTSDRYGSQENFKLIGWVK